MDRYKVRPRRKRRGWKLESERLSHGSLWFETESDALGYAKWNSRVNGCRVEILDDREKVIRSEEFPGGDFAY
jgi:hypothetical protein